MDLDSRVAIVGLNGSGKSTLLKLMTGELEPIDGMVKRHNHLKIGMYHQHLADALPMDMNPLDYFVSFLFFLPPVNGTGCVAVERHSQCANRMAMTN